MGMGWDTLRAHWTELLASRKAEGDSYVVIDNVADLRAKWPGILASHPDLIEIYLLDGERYEELHADTNALDRNGRDPALVRPIVASAHQSGLRVAAHIETAADFRTAVAAGVDIIAHLPGLAIRSDQDIPRFTLTDADAALAASHKAIVIPTAWLASQDRISGGDHSQIERTRTVQVRNMRLLLNRGVRLAIGSDLFENASIEARYLLALGVVSNAALLNVWVDTASVIFPDRRIGRLSDGYEASFLVLACNPVTEFRCVEQIRSRMKQGELLPNQ